MNYVVKLYKEGGMTVKIKYVKKQMCLGLHYIKGYRKRTNNNS